MIEKTILRPSLAHTFSHSLGHSRPNKGIDFKSALTSTPDISLHRTKRREGSILLQKSFSIVDQKIFGPQARFSCKDMGGHVISRLTHQ